MRNIGSRPMCRAAAMPLTRPICISQRTSQKNHLVLGRRLIILVSAVLGLLVTRAECNALSDSESITQESMINNNTRSNQNLLTNDVILDSNDEDSFHLGFSGYLRNSSSTLDFQGKYQNFTDTNVLLANNSTKESPKTIGHRRVKRGVTHLYNMIVCATGCNPLAYKGYGCYCGFLGSGYPMDGIDRCCKMHDWCYDATDCPMFVEYFVPYYWKCYHGYKPICAIDHGEWGSSGSCAQRLCECDRSFSECLRRYRCPRHKAVCTSSPWRLIQNLFMII